MFLPPPPPDSPHFVPPDPITQHDDRGITWAKPVFKAPDLPDWRVIFDPPAFRNQSRADQDESKQA